ncbi:MAG: phosphoethanolamine transferase [Steroidobacteraceae bacterium]
MTKKVLYSCLALAAACAAPALVTAICAVRFQTARTVVTVLLTTLLLAFLIAALTRTWRRFFLVCFPLFAVSSAFAAYTAMFGVPPGRALAMVLVNVSWEEVIGFLNLSQGKTLALCLLAAAAAYLFLALRLPHIPMFAGEPVSRRLTRSRAMLLASLPVTVYAASNPIDLIDGIANNPVTGSAMFLAGDLPRASADMKGAQVHKVPYRAQRQGAGEEVHILVVGESARRESWSVYGYRRPTTPYLNTLKNEAIFLQNAVADANLTSWSVPIILTGMTPEEVMVVPFRGNLLDLAKEGGYGTTWLVNQDIALTSYVGIHADHMVYPPEIQTSLFDRDTLDQSLLPGYRTAISRAGSARFIGLHVMGSHWVYNRRYPKNFEQFGSSKGLTEISVFDSRKNDMAAVVDAYDNSVAYTDWFLRQLIESARALQVPVTLTFFPDHGEDLELLDGQMGHGGPAYSRHSFEIPAFVWMNDPYRKAHPEKVAALRGNASKQIRSHNVFATVADLMGITWPQAAPRRSFASDQFVPDTQMRYAAGGLLVSHPP